jgi:hypothetical protein
MTDTKRVNELVAGDIVIFPGEKGVMTISTIEKLKDESYLVDCFGISVPSRYEGSFIVTYLGNSYDTQRKEEKRVKVDISALYPYSDLLAYKEVSLGDATNIPVYVKQQLKYIHELFEDVLELTLAEVKAFYFERKGSKREAPKTKTKKAKELCVGDKVAVLETKRIVTKLRYYSDNHIEVHFLDDSCVIYRRDEVVQLC